MKGPPNGVLATRKFIRYTNNCKYWHRITFILLVSPIFHAIDLRWEIFRHGQEQGKSNQILTSSKFKLTLCEMLLVFGDRSIRPVAYKNIAASSINSSQDDVTEATVARFTLFYIASCDRQRNGGDIIATLHHCVQTTIPTTSFPHFI